MSDLYLSYKTFSNNEFGEIRVLEIENEPWFVGKDIAEVLGYKNTNDAVRTHVDEEDKGNIKILTHCGKQNMKIINESGLWCLIENNRLISCNIKQSFIKWLSSEGLIHKSKVIKSRKEIEFRYHLEKLFKTAKRVVESYIDKENSKIVLEMMLQYPVLNYKIDFYFPFFHLAIEYDEYEHKSKVDYDNKRQYEIEKYFESKGSYINFIRVEEGNEEKAIGELIGHLINFSL